MLDVYGPANAHFLHRDGDPENLLLVAYSPIGNTRFVEGR